MSLKGLKLEVVMFGIVTKVAAAALTLGFGAGIVAHRKAGKVKEEIKQKFSNTDTEILYVQVPKGLNIDQCRVKTTILVPQAEEIVDAKMQ
jgi:hypothetical protein